MPRFPSNNQLAEDLADSLKSTTELVQKLLDEIRENSTSVAVMKEKFESLNENVSVLSQIVKNGGGKNSMITRLALAEKSIEDLNEHVTELKKVIEDVEVLIQEREDEKKAHEEEIKKFKRDKFIARIGFWAALIPGITALAMQIIPLIIK
jgi:chromosome segregation ATPase